MLAAHLVLALAIAAIWLPSLPAIAGVRIPPWAILFCVALALASYSGIVDAKGWLSIGFLGALMIGSATAPAGPRFNLRGVFQTATVLMLFGFAIQQIPGFTGTTFISGVRLSADAAPMRLTARFDVGMAALFLTALFCNRVRSFAELRSIVAPTVAVGLVTTVAVMSSALIAGYIRFDPKWPPFTLAHLGKTLLITAVVEEAFFRGVLQQFLLIELTVEKDSRLGVRCKDVSCDVESGCFSSEPDIENHDIRGLRQVAGHDLLCRRGHRDDFDIEARQNGGQSLDDQGVIVRNQDSNLCHLVGP